MVNSFSVAVENSAANFISKNNLLCGNVLEDLLLNLNPNGVKVLLCFDQGWFSVGKQIKDELSKKQEVISFSLEENAHFEECVNKLLSSVFNIEEIIVIGSEELALFAVNYLNNSGRVIYIPLDFDFSEFIVRSLDLKSNHLVFLDKNLLNKCYKNKMADGARHVLSKKLVLVEMLINEHIGALLPNNEAKNLFASALGDVYKYFTNHSLELLVTAIIKASVAEQKAGVSSIPTLASAILFKSENLSLKGEREYLFYKMVLRAYGMFFTNNTDCTISLPGVLLEQEEIAKLFPFEYKEMLAKLPEYLYDNEKTALLKKKICENSAVISEINKQLSQIEKDAELIKNEYGGRKYTVELYNLKQRAKALSLAPYIAKKPTAFHLLFAQGLTKYFE